MQDIFNYLSKFVPLRRIVKLSICRLYKYHIYKIWHVGKCQSLKFEYPNFVTGVSESASWELIPHLPAVYYSRLKPRANLVGFLDYLKFMTPNIFSSLIISILENEDEEAFEKYGTILLKYNYLQHCSHEYTHGYLSDLRLFDSKLIERIMLENDPISKIYYRSFTLAGITGHPFSSTLKGLNISPYLSVESYRSIIRHEKRIYFELLRVIRFGAGEKLAKALEGLSDIFLDNNYIKCSRVEMEFLRKFINIFDKQSREKIQMWFMTFGELKSKFKKDLCRKNPKSKFVRDLKTEKKMGRFMQSIEFSNWGCGPFVGNLCANDLARHFYARQRGKRVFMLNFKHLRSLSDKSRAKFLEHYGLSNFAYCPYRQHIMSIFPNSMPENMDKEPLYLSKYLSKTFIKNTNSIIWFINSEIHFRKLNKQLVLLFEAKCTRDSFVWTTFKLMCAELTWFNKQHAERVICEVYQN